MDCDGSPECGEPLSPCGCESEKGDEYFYAAAVKTCKMADTNEVMLDENELWVGGVDVECSSNEGGCGASCDVETHGVLWNHQRIRF